MIEWTGVLARVEETTPDGRLLRRPERLLSRPLPLPLFNIDSEPVGSITTLSIHGDEVRMEGTLRDGYLTDDRPAIPVALDADECDVQAVGEGVIFTSWRIVGATLLLAPTDTPPWPEAVIRAKEAQP